MIKEEGVGRGRRARRGGWEGEWKRQLKAGAHLLRLPCQVKEEKAMNIKPEVCACIMCLCVCVCGREGETERQSRQTGRQQPSRSRKRERERERRGGEGVLGNGRSGRVCHSC